MYKRLRRSRAEDESRIFRQVEAIIEGTFRFIVRFLRTTAFLALHPRRLRRLIDAPDEDPMVVRPVTYLTVAAVLFAPSLRFAVRQVVEAMESFVHAMTWAFSSGNPNVGPVPTTATSPRSLLEELPDVSVSSVVDVTLPTVIAIMTVAAIVGSITQRIGVVNRRSLVHAICYAAASQFMVFSLSIIGLGVCAAEIAEALDRSD